MLRLVGDFIFAIGWIVGRLKYMLGIICPIPTRYRSASWDRDGEDSSS